ncbi:hypothetical protein B0H63DRAFT_462785 [Podospora didyma]|uniref:U4/U6 snRNA-associated-splicing factor PRP24 n=1 Tax=Podospora didyma TaxID=330526 RepID=A0AAE0P8C5_9PEZI|nr:hypothetical protein B0H63DRAFT_462785 [Podospora didyma]
MASPVGEDNWVDYVDHQLREAADFETRVNVVESFRRAVSAEPGSLKVWMAYCEYFWSLYTDCQPGNDAGWPVEDQHLGREMFTLDAALNLWQQGYEAVQYRLSDSHELWNRWISLEMELLARTATEAGIRRITHLFKNRLTVPHATWDNTSSMFSSFLSEYNPKAYETEMVQVNKSSKDAMRLYSLRDPFEMRLAATTKSGDAEAAKNTMVEYIEWEIRQSKTKRDPVVNFRICLGLFSRALNGILADHDATWHNYIVLISTSHTELKAGRSKIPAGVLPNILDVLQSAVRHIPWSGPVWARYILAAEEAGLSFTDIERIKHAATNSAKLDRDGMTGVLEMYSAWCGYLKRTAMDPTATEEAVDLAEVGLPTALEDVKHWGKRKWGDTYQGDPSFRLEKILIQFLTEKKDDIEGARAVWEQMSNLDIHANCYDFWLNWFLWEMVAFTATKAKMRSPTPVTLSQGLRVPSYATRVFEKALKVPHLDWPERIMEVYLQHCNDYELAETLRQAQDTIYKTRKRVAKRREREAAEAAKQSHAAYEAQAQAQAQAEAQAEAQKDAEMTTEDQPMTEAPEAPEATEATETTTSPAPKRKRALSPAAEDAGNKRAKNGLENGEEVKRDREHTSVFVANLPSDVTLTRVRQFFREYGHLNNVDLQKPEDELPVAMVEFRAPEEAEVALLRDGKPFGKGGKIVQVTSAHDCTLYVTNYPPEADEQYLRDLFKDAGKIHSIRFPSLKFNVRRRFCYITFREQASAAAALKLHGKSLEGGKFKLSAQLSNPDIKRQRHGPQVEERELHVRNLPKFTSDEDLKGIFSKAGNVVSARILRNQAGYSHGTAFVAMSTKEEAQEAIKTLDKLVVAHHSISVELSNPTSVKTGAALRSLDTISPVPETESPAAGSPSSGGAPVAGPTAAELAARKISVLNVPDTMTDARLKAVLANAHVGTIQKLELKPMHGGAILEFPDATSAGKAALAINGLEIAGGKKLRTGTVKELFEQEGETRIDRVDGQVDQQKQLTASQLMPPPALRRPPVLGRAGAKRGLGFTVSAKKQSNGAPPSGDAAPAVGAAPAGPSKSNADFMKMFLEGNKKD